MLMRKEDRNKHLEDIINTSGDKLFILRHFFYYAMQYIFYLTYI